LDFDFAVEDFYCLGSPIGKCQTRFLAIFCKIRKQNT
jgi:hypothetical protein